MIAGTTLVLTINDMTITTTFATMTIIIMMIVDFWQFLIEKDRLVSRPLPSNAQLTQKQSIWTKLILAKHFFHSRMLSKYWNC